jgi:hypothetical protein
MRILFHALLILCPLMVPVAAQPASSGPFLFPVGLTPLYEKPLSNGFPVAFLEPSDTCMSDSSASDNVGTLWRRVASGKNSGWVLASALHDPASSEEPSGQKKAGFRKTDPDAKRRYRVIEQHPEWPRRIIKAIREGTICLDMDEGQLIASWGEPLQKGKAFILGAGRQELWYYKDADGTMQTVILNRGRVVGWSE